MKIIIIGGGNIGYGIAVPLIRENHNVTIIEKNENKVKKIKNELDAMVISGDGVDIETLNSADIKNCDMFIAVADDDNVNFLSSVLAKKLNIKMKVIVKIKQFLKFFNNDSCKATDFPFDHIINPNDLVIEKIEYLIANPYASDLISFYDNQIQLLKLTINDKFIFANQTLTEIAKKNTILQRIRITAILRQAMVIIPHGDEMILPGDRIFCAGKTEDINTFIKNSYTDTFKIKNVIISSEPKILPDLLNKLKKHKYKITVIDPDKATCHKLAQNTDKIKIINGFSTDSSIINELNFKDSCYISLTDNDEFNIVSSTTLKNNGISKVMCSIKNMSLISILSSIEYIDCFFSSNVMTTGEILKFSRKGNINSITYFSEINAETIEISIFDEIPILGQKLKDIKIPDGMIIMSIIRGEEIIIPTGDDYIIKNDRVIVFVLTKSLQKVDMFFVENLIIGR